MQGGLRFRRRQRIAKYPDLAQQTRMFDIARAFLQWHTPRVCRDARPAPAFRRKLTRSRVCLQGRCGTIEPDATPRFRLPSTPDQSFCRCRSRGVFQLLPGEFE